MPDISDAELLAQFAQHESEVAFAALVQRHIALVHSVALRHTKNPQLAQDAWGESDPLTDRERQVLRASEEGWAGAEIARRLNLSEGTVRNYLSEAIAKLGVTNRIEAARLARQRGWL